MKQNVQNIKYRFKIFFFHFRKLVKNCVFMSHMYTMTYLWLNYFFVKEILSLCFLFESQKWNTPQALNTLSCRKLFILDAIHHSKTLTLLLRTMPLVSCLLERNENYLSMQALLAFHDKYNLGQF